MANANYKSEVLKELEAFEGNRQSYYVNKVYRATTGAYYYINQRGYRHVLKICRINYSGKFSHYEINDYLIQNDGTPKLTNSYGCFKTREDALANIENKMFKPDYGYILNTYFGDLRDTITTEDLKRYAQNKGFTVDELETLCFKDKWDVAATILKAKKEANECISIH